jgi:uncharacterized membrane protein
MNEKEEKKEVVGAVETLIDRDRVLSFSDAIFAFAATLLVLKIDIPGILPHQVESSFFQVLAHLWPQYFANIVSFLMISYYWLCHHAVFGLMKRFNATIVWLNVIFLISIAFLPFPVDVFGDYSRVPDVVIFYTASLALVGYLLAGIWWYASKDHRLIDKTLSKHHIQFYTMQILVAPVVFTLSMPLVYIDPWITKFSWLFVIIGIWAVNKVFKYKRLNEIEKTIV